MKEKHFLRRLLPLLLTAVLIIPLAQPLAVTKTEAKKVTQAEIDNLKKNADELNRQKKELKNQLKDVKADKNAALNKKYLIEKQMGVIEEEISNIDDQITTYGQLIEEKGAEIEDAQAEESDQYRHFCGRVRNMEETGQISYWSVLFSSKSFSDLLDNFMMVEEIISYDNAVMDNLIEIREQIEAEKAELEGLKAEQVKAREEQVKAKAELSDREGEVDSLIKEIKTHEDELEAREEELRKAADKVDAEIKLKEKQMAEQIANVPSESGFLWPLPGYNVLSSLYGPRINPVTHRPQHHQGIDIPAPRGTHILASKSGIVVTSTRMRGGYGNYVAISHSDGTSTLYAHMNKRLVKEGQKVKQGQVIGHVGTTGRSTGNHLHYEIRVKGTRKDPIDFFKEKTFYVRAKGKTVKLDH